MDNITSYIDKLQLLVRIQRSQNLLYYTEHNLLEREVDSSKQEAIVVDKNNASLKSL